MLDVETDAYIHCVSAFVKLAQSEYQLLADIIPEHHQKKTFDSLIQVPCRSGALQPAPARAVTTDSCSPQLQPPPPPCALWTGPGWTLTTSPSPHFLHTGPLHPTRIPHQPGASSHHPTLP